MNIYVHQSIHINILRINSMANSAIVQIGTAGSIRARSTITNSGGFKEAAETTTNQGGVVTTSLQSFPLQQ